MLCTGKNDLTRRVTHREAVYGPVIHSIFDAWHYEVLWTCKLTRLLRYACDYERLILYIMLHSIKLPNALHCTLPSTLCSTLLIALDCTLPACLTYAPKEALKKLPSTPPSTFSSTLPGMLPRTLPLALDGTHPACWTVHSQSSSQEALKHTTEHALKYTPN